MASIFLSALSTGPAVAEEVEDNWKLVVAPYLFMAGIDGNSTVGRVGGPVDVPFGDILQSLKIAGMVHVEVWKGHWGYLTDIAYLRLGEDISVANSIIADVEVEEAIIEKYFARRFKRDQGLLDLYAGIRYWHLDLDLALTAGSIGTSGDRKEDWIDPVIGARYITPLGSRWRANIQADVGGFGVSSDFTWSLQGGVVYEVSDRFEVAFQYKYLDVKYDEGASGTPEFFEYDIATHGPLIGALFHF